MASNLKRLSKSPILVKILIYIMISLTLTLLLFVVFRNWIVSGGIGINDMVSIMLSQVSSTFIVLSLTSVLSTNIGVIYWQDIKDIKLIKPFFFCFYALTTYLITAMVISVIGFFIGNSEIQISAFVVSIITLIALTVKMLGVYFGRDAIEHDLMWEYIKIVNSKGKTNSRAKHYCKQLLDLYEKDAFLLRKNEVKELHWLISINDQDSIEAIEEGNAEKYQGDPEAAKKWKQYSDELKKTPYRLCWIVTKKQQMKTSSFCLLPAT